ARARFETVPLNVSFRSTPLILHAVDRVFETDQARKGVTRSGDVPPHEAKRAGQPGLVEIWPTVRPDETDEPDPWDAPLDWEGPTSPRVRLAERIAAQIDGWLQNEELLASKGRPIEPGDILILVRRRDTFVDAVVRALKRRQIPVAGADRLVLTDHIAVRDLLALARFVLLAEDDLTLATVLKSPLLARPDACAFDDRDLFDLAHDRPGALWTVLADRARSDAAMAHAHVQLKAWRGRADWQQPYEFFSQVLGPDGARRRFVERLGTEANDPIDEFLGLALQYERQHVPSLQGFLHWMTAADTAIKRDMEHGLNEVRVMTVHGAKGLEANIVFLPDTCTVPDRRHDPKIMLLPDSAGPRPLPVWPIARAYETTPVAEARAVYQIERLEEYNRLLYVAMTRACDRLYVGGYETRNRRAAGCWYDMVRDALKPEAQEIADARGDVLCWRLEDTGAGDLEEDRTAHDDRFAPEQPPPWARTDPPPEPEVLRPLAPSRLEQVTDGSSQDAGEQTVLSPLRDTDQDRFKRGRIIHALLQILPGIEMSERTVRARRYVEQAGFALSGEVQDEILGAVFGVLDDSRFSSLFGPASRAEVPVIARLAVAGRELVISGQVDRLVVMADEVLIVDHKTNRPAPAKVEEVAPGYVRQLAAYRMALAALYPDRTIRGLLLWTDGPMVMEIPQAALDRALDRSGG
ncbi:MAG: 3'-5' exonuclease, partial [Hyphomicrobiales bacterium]